MDPLVCGIVGLVVGFVLGVVADGLAREDGP